MASGRWSQEDLAGPPFPEALAYLWAWWLELTSDRTWSDMGRASPVTWEKVAAWKGMTGAEVRPYEALALLELDRAWREPGELKDQDLAGWDGPEEQDESIWPEGWRD